MKFVPLQRATFNTCDNSVVNQPESSFQEIDFIVLRRHGSALLRPVLFLGLLSASFFFVDARLTESLHHQILLGAVLLAGLLLWFLPSIRFFTNRYELSSNRILIHSGLTGSKVIELPWGEITGVSVSRGFGSWIQGAGDIRLHREFGQDEILKRVPRAKKLSKEIERFLISRANSFNVGN